MKAVIITENSVQAERVFDKEIREKLNARYELCPTMLCRKNFERHMDFLKSAEYIFATWGFGKYSEEEIKKYFPNVKCVFYAAGSVQEFAKEFIECGIRVFSGWQANAIPVAEYTYAQILLAAKGFYRAERKARWLFYPAAHYSDHCGGNYRVKVGIIGVGSIGKLVAERLKSNDAQVFYYDPFLSAETAKTLNIIPASLDEIFSECDVITNHLANKEELTGILSGKLFSKMKPYATFINTGRGRQVDEKGLVKAMKKVKTRTALLDVTSKEPLPMFGKLARCRNIIVTPHIAGSNGREVVRMAEYMLEEAIRLENNEKPFYEVNSDMLKTMA